MLHHPERPLTAALLLGLALSLAPATPLSAQEPATPRSDMALAMSDGSARAESAGTGGYFAGGLASGLLLGLIGTGITYAVASSSDVSLPAQDRLIIADRAPEYVQSYHIAYTERVRQKRKQSGLVGGLLGTAALLLIVASSS